MYKPLHIGNLVAKFPIIQGGMGVGISLSSLAGAVAANGGIGVISTAQIGYLEEDFYKKPLEANLRMIGEHIKKAREIAPKGILGVNIMVATKQYKSYVLEAVKHGIDIVISGAGLPIELPSLVKNSKTKIVPIVSSLKAAAILLKLWDKKENTTADGIIIEGPEAGGHLGFDITYLQEKEWEEKEDINSTSFVQEVTDIIKLVKTYEEKYEKDIPVIIAGGIDNKEKMDYYLNLGASGIQVSTKFVPTIECDADIKFKEAYIGSKKEDIVYVNSPVGMPGRGLNTDFVKRTKEGPIKVSRCTDCIVTCNPGTTPYCITEALIRAAKGDINNGLVFCGANAYKENSMRTVSDIFNDFFDTKEDI